MHQTNKTHDYLIFLEIETPFDKMITVRGTVSYVQRTSTIHQQKNMIKYIL